jgi:excisionase family DNA binding protein
MTIRTVDPPLGCSIDDVCDYLGLSRDFVYDQVRLGTLRCAKLARQLRFRRRDVDYFVDQHMVAEGAAVPLRPATRGGRA